MVNTTTTRARRAGPRLLGAPALLLVCGTAGAQTHLATDRAVHAAASTHAASTHAAPAASSDSLHAAALPGTLVSEESMDADRPGFTTGPALLAPGRQQVETGYSFSRVGAQRDHALGEVRLRAGVMSALELQVVLNSFELSAGPEGRASGLNDAGVAAKVHLLEHADGASIRPEASLLAGASLPTGGRAFGQHHSEPEAVLSAAWSTPHATSLTVNVGAARRDAGDGARVGEYTSGVSFGWRVAPHIGSYVELFDAYTAAHVAEPGAEHRYLNTGLTFAPGHVLQLDTWTAVGLHRGAPDYRLGVGLARRW